MDPTSERSNATQKLKVHIFGVLGVSVYKQKPKNHTDVPTVLI